MTRFPSVCLRLAILPATCFLATGCPLLLDDRFQTQSGDSEGSGGVSGGGAGAPDMAQAGGSDSRVTAGGAAGASNIGGSANSAAAASNNAGSGGTNALGTACQTDELLGTNGHCYFIDTAAASWESARATCQDRGAGWDLATIKSAGDSSFLTTVLTTEVWVGADDSNGGEVWSWVGDGAEFWEGSGTDGNKLNDAYVNWNSDEPNGGGGTDCLRILPTAVWADLECDSGRPALCEGPLR